MKLTLKRFLKQKPIYSDTDSDKAADIKLHWQQRQIKIKMSDKTLKVPYQMNLDTHNTTHNLTMTFND